MKKKLLIVDDVHKSIKDYLEENNFDVIHIPEYDREEILKVISDQDGMIYRAFGSKYDEEILRKASKLKCMVRTGGGAGAIDFKVANEQNIVIMHTSGCNSFTAAEFIFGAFFDLARKISEANTIFRSGRYDRSSLWSNELTGKTAGIIGFGRMGKHLSKMTNAFNMNTISYSPNITKEEEDEYNITGVTLDELYQQADFISIAFPVKNEHQGMFNKEKFAMMKEGVNLVNMTWMGLFDEDAMVNALENGKIGGVVIERPSFDPSKDHPFMKFDNVVFTPAIGSNSHEGQIECGIQAAKLTMNYLNNGKIKNQIKRDS